MALLLLMNGTKISQIHNLLQRNEAEVILVVEEGFYIKAWQKGKREIGYKLTDVQSTHEMPNFLASCLNWFKIVVSGATMMVVVPAKTQCCMV